MLKACALSGVREAFKERNTLKTRGELSELIQLQLGELRFRMTQMMEMSSIMLEQLQEHVTVTFYRVRDVVEWVTWTSHSPDMS